MSPVRPAPKKVVARAKAKPKLNPVEAAVQATISGQVAPKLQQQQQTLAQKAADLLQAQRVNKATENELRTLQTRSGMSTGDMLNLAAARTSGNVAADAQNTQTLQRMFGANAFGGSGAQGIANSGAAARVGANAANTANAWDVGLTGRLQQDFLGRAEATSGLIHQEFNRDRSHQAAKDLQAIATEIAAIRGQAPVLRRTYQMENDRASLERQIANREYGLSNRAQTLAEQQAAFTKTETKWQRGLANRQLQAQKDATLLSAASAGGAQGPALVSGAGGVPMSSTEKTSAKEIYNQILPTKTYKNEDGKWVTKTVPVPRPWRTAFERLTANGFDPNRAALLAEAWVQKGHNKNKVNGKGDYSPVKVIEMLQGGGVGLRVRENILMSRFGAPFATKPKVVQGSGSYPTQRYRPVKKAPPGLVEYIALRSPEFLSNQANAQYHGFTFKGKKYMAYSRPGKGFDVYHAGIPVK